MVITGRRVRTELRTVVVCFIISFLTNIGAIMFYNRPWTEMFTQIGFVIIIAVTLYIITVLLRAPWHIIRFYAHKFKKK